MGVLTDADREALWDGIVQVRDAYPRITSDAPTDEVVTAVAVVVERIVRARMAQAWDEAAAAAQDSITARWLTNANPYRDEEPTA